MVATRIFHGKLFVITRWSYQSPQSPLACPELFFCRVSMRLCATCLSTPRGIETYRDSTVVSTVLSTVVSTGLSLLMPFLALFVSHCWWCRFCIAILVDLHTPWVFDAVDERTCLTVWHSKLRIVKVWGGPCVLLHINSHLHVHGYSLYLFIVFLASRTSSMVREEV